MSGLSELERELLEALKALSQSFDDYSYTHNFALPDSFDSAKAVIDRAEAKAKEPQCVGGCVCDLQEVAKAHGQEAKVEPPCSDFAPLELHPDYCLFCEHARACHSSAVEG